MLDNVPRRGRQLAASLLVGVLVVTAGCSGLGVGGETASPASATDEPTTTDAGQMTSHAAQTTAAEQSADGTTATGESTTTGSDGTDQTHTADGSGDATPSADGDATGKLTVVVAGTELNLREHSQSSDSSFWIDDGDEHTWHGSGGMTLAEALGTLGVDASGDQLAYNGTTYRESTDGTDIYVRVNGEPVDPTTYELEDGDEVWVTVETTDMDVDTPGTYIKADQQHIHGPMAFSVDGQEVDFSKEKYQSGHKHFHFEGGHANPWHAHSFSITLEYAMSTLEGIDATENTVTYDGTTYDGDDPGTTVTVEVNGEAVTPSEYFLKDGDSISIVVETDG